MKTSELTGAQLDAWVARANGWTFGPPHKVHGWDVWRGPDGVITGTIPASAYQPSTCWAEGGLIIERERITIVPPQSAGDFGAWSAFQYGSVDADIGPTPLVAAMRCYVASKFGDEVLDA